ncbi:MAG: hypothetical protein V7637_4333 [Mycobacteriales bacterium]
MTAQDAPAGTAARRTRRWPWRVGTLVVGTVAIAVAVSGQWRLLAGSVTGSTPTGQTAPCLPGRAVQVMNSPHLSAAALASVRYDSLPPTSGPHLGFTIAPGIYTAPLTEGLTVHAMEHGHVIVQYATGTPAGTVQDLRRLARRYPRDVILAPYPKLADGIALTAWGRIDLLDRYDEQRAAAFIEALRGRYIHGWTHPDPCPVSR